jgi:hypothetical protein
MITLTNANQSPPHLAQTRDPEIVTRIRPP